MATAQYLAELAKFDRVPIHLVKLTIAGTISGSQTFRLQSKDAPSLSVLLCEDVRPYITGVRGRGTRILPDKAVTERGRLAINCIDDPDAPDFDSSVFSIFKGGSFFRRLILAQPDFIGSTIEVFRGFYAPGFTENDFELIFEGTLQDVNFGAGQQVSLVAKDRLLFADVQAPVAISDDNVLSASITPANTVVSVRKGVEFIDPALYPSRDFFPYTVRIDPDSPSSKEDIIVNAKTGNSLVVQQNFAAHSEDFSNGVWTKDGGTSVIADVEASPFGGANRADRIDFGGVAAGVEQVTAMTANANSVFSIWLKSVGTAEGDVRLFMDDNGGGETVAQDFFVTKTWARYQVALGFADGTNVRVRVEQAPGGLTQAVAYGAQVEKGTLQRGFYAATQGSAGETAGRGAFGTTAGSHGVETKILDVLIYRQWITPTPDSEGVHPIVILRDLVNRGFVPVANVDENSFTTQFNFSPGLQFRRGLTSSSDTTITKPRSLSRHIQEVREQALIDIWATEGGLVRTIFTWLINNPEKSDVNLSDEQNVVLNSSSYSTNSQSRITRVFAYYGFLGGTTEGDKPEDFQNVQVNLEAGIEQASGQRAKVLLSKWIFRASEASSAAGRYLRRFKRGAKIGRWEFDVKDDAALQVGDFLRLNSEDLLTNQASSEAIRGETRFQIVQKRERRKSGTIEVEGLEAAGLRVGLICENGTPDHPAATADERACAFISDVNSRVADTLATGPISLTGASYTEATKRLVEASAFSGFSFTGADYIFLTHASITANYVRIAAKISDDEIELERFLRTPTNALPGDLAGVTNDAAKDRAALVDGYTIL